MRKRIAALLLPALALALASCRATSPAPAEGPVVAGDLPEIRYYEIADT